MIEHEKLRIPSACVAVTPDVVMSDLLKTTRASEICITGLPDVTVRRAKKNGLAGQTLYEVELKGLDLFDNVLYSSGQGQGGRPAPDTTAEVPDLGGHLAT